MIAVVGDGKEVLLSRGLKSWKEVAEAILNCWWDFEKASVDGERLIERVYLLL